MAKKKEQQRSYMQMYIPSGDRKKYVSDKAMLYGLDRRENADTNTMSECRNIDVTRLPEIVSAELGKKYTEAGEEVRGVYGYGNYLFVLTASGGIVTLTRFDGNTSAVSVSWDSLDDDVRREMAVYCLYDVKDNEIAYETEPTYYIMVYPDVKCIPIDFKGDTTVEAVSSASPVFEHITVWNGRLFGTRENVVVCSSASTFRDFTLDSPESEDASGLVVGGYDASHAWYSTTQANIQSNGNITAITAYEGHPIVFKDDYMHQINNNKNPFRFQDICAIGCVSARSVCELDSVLYFASRDGIYRYSGGYPKKISESLDYENFDENTVCGAYNDVLYLYDYNLGTDAVFTYCPKNGLWATIDNPYSNNKIVSFAVNDNGFYAVYNDGNIYEIQGETKKEYTEWEVVSDRILSKSSGDKRIHSIGIVASGDDLTVTISKDGSGTVTTSKKELVGVDKLRALIRKSDSLFHKVRLSGNGAIHIQRVELTYSYSGNRYI
jgi:hypothetical protein